MSSELQPIVESQRPVSKILIIMSRKLNVYRMSDETAAKFVELYRQNDCLWDTACENYKSKEARITAYKRISSEMGITGFGPREVAQKIKNLRSAYHQEVRKVEASRKRSERGAVGDLYKPKVIWFDVVDTFLRPIVRGKSCEANSTPKRLDQEQLASERQYDSESIQHLHITDRPSNGTCIRGSEDDIQAIQDGQSIQRKASEDESLRMGEVSACDQRNPIKKTKLTANGRSVKNSGNPAKFADDIDDYDPLGRYVAASLRKMPFEYGISAESEIHDVIVKYKVYAMKKEALPTHQKSFPPGQSTFGRRAEGGQFATVSALVSNPKSTIPTCQVGAIESRCGSLDGMENGSDSSRASSHAPSENNDDHLPNDRVR